MAMAFLLETTRHWPTFTISSMHAAAPLLSTCEGRRSREDVVPSRTG